MERIREKRKTLYIDYRRASGNILSKMTELSCAETNPCVY
jgi:hypothetical protein